MQNYGKIAATPVPQSQPLTKDQVLNAAGGYVWEVDKWSQLDRFILLGTIGGTYYIDEHKLTLDNIDAVQACVHEDAGRVALRIAELSAAGRAVKNDPALFVLALMVVEGGEARKQALPVLNQVARIPTHLFHFLQYHKDLDGKWNRSLRTAVSNWYNSKDIMSLAYHLTKYQSRDGWSHQDVLRLAHTKPVSVDASLLFKDQLGKGVDASEFTSPKLALYMEAVWYLRAVGAADDKAKFTKGATERIRALKLPREVVPTELLNSPDVWEALLTEMPTTALVRSLAKMTNIDLLNAMSEQTQRVVGDLTNEAKIQKSKIHPLSVLLAKETYNRGRGVRGSLTWTPVSVIVDALDSAFRLSFGNIEPIGQRVLVSLDVSGSMNASAGGDIGFTCKEAGAAVLYILAKTEPRCVTTFFHTSCIPMTVGGQSLAGVINEANRHHGGTDIAQPIIYAQANKIPVDLFVILTDNESWAGRIHAQTALEQYRKAMGIQSKVVLLACAANQSSVGSPRDPLVLNCVGFDASVPQVIKTFAQG